MTSVLHSTLAAGLHWQNREKKTSGLQSHTQKMVVEKVVEKKIVEKVNETDR